MPLLVLVVLWVVVSLIAAPMIGALFVSRQRKDRGHRADLYGRVRGPGGGEPPMPGGEELEK